MFPHRQTNQTSVLRYQQTLMSWHVLTCLLTFQVAMLDTCPRRSRRSRRSRYCIQQVALPSARYLFFRFAFSIHVGPIGFPQDSEAPCYRMLQDVSHLVYLLINFVDCLRWPGNCIIPIIHIIRSIPFSCCSTLRNNGACTVIRSLKVCSHSGQSMGFCTAPQIQRAKRIYKAKGKTSKNAVEDVSSHVKFTNPERTWQQWCATVNDQIGLTMSYFTLSPWRMTSKMIGLGCIWLKKNVKLELTHRLWCPQLLILTLCGR